MQSPRRLYFRVSTLAQHRVFRIPAVSRALLLLLCSRLARLFFDTSAGYPEEQYHGKLRLSLSAQVPGTMRNRPPTSRGDGQAAPVHRRVHGKEQRSGRHTKCFTLYELLFLAE